MLWYLHKRYWREGSCSTFLLVVLLKPLESSLSHQSVKSLRQRHAVGNFWKWEGQYRQACQADSTIGNSEMRDCSSIAITVISSVHLRLHRHRSLQLVDIVKTESNPDWHYIFKSYQIYRMLCKKWAYPQLKQKWATMIAQTGADFKNDPHGTACSAHTR